MIHCRSERTSCTPVPLLVRAHTDVKLQTGRSDIPLTKNGENVIKKSAPNYVGRGSVFPSLSF